MIILKIVFGAFILWLVGCIIFIVWEALPIPKWHVDSSENSVTMTFKEFRAFYDLNPEKWSLTSENYIYYRVPHCGSYRLKMSPISYYRTRAFLKKKDEEEVKGRIRKRRNGARDYVLNDIKKDLDAFQKNTERKDW